MPFIDSKISKKITEEEEIVEWKVRKTRRKS